MFSFEIALFNTKLLDNADMWFIEERNTYNMLNTCIEEVTVALEKYRGKLITIGSDAHSPDRVGYALDMAKKMLSDIGFTHYYYEKRKPVAVCLE